jgi:cystathionine beta-lyase/cystathionine gamma-synthase
VLSSIRLTQYQKYNTKHHKTDTRQQSTRNTTQNITRRILDNTVPQIQHNCDVLCCISGTVLSFNRLLMFLYCISGTVLSSIRLVVFCVVFLVLTTEYQKYNTKHHKTDTRQHSTTNTTQNITRRILDNTVPEIQHKTLQDGLCCISGTVLFSIRLVMFCVVFLVLCCLISVRRILDNTVPEIQHKTLQDGY